MSQGPTGPGGPPPPPWERQGWAPPDPDRTDARHEGAEPATGGEPGGTDPAGARRRRRGDRRAIVLASVAAVLLGVPSVLAAIGFQQAASELDQGPVAGAPGDDDGDAGEGPGPAPRDDVEVPELDLDELDGRDAELGELLTVIDAAERTMLAAQEGIADAALAAPEGDLEALREGVADAAGEGQRRLQELRSDVTRQVDDELTRDLRDRYRAHLDAWVRYLVAVEDEPDLPFTQEGGEVFSLAIDTTAAEFSELLRDLPDDVAPEVRELADAIAERGFPERDPADAV